MIKTAPSHTQSATRISNMRKTSAVTLKPYSGLLPIPEALDCNVPVDHNKVALDQRILLCAQPHSKHILTLLQLTVPSTLQVCVCKAIVAWSGITARGFTKPTWPVGGTSKQESLGLAAASA